MGARSLASYFSPLAPTSTLLTLLTVLKRKNAMPETCVYPEAKPKNQVPKKFNNNNTRITNEQQETKEDMTKNTYSQHLSQDPKTNPSKKHSTFPRPKHHFYNDSFSAHRPSPPPVYGPRPSPISSFLDSQVAGLILGMEKLFTPRRRAQAPIPPLSLVPAPSRTAIPLSASPTSRSLAGSTPRWAHPLAFGATSRQPLYCRPWFHSTKALARSRYLRAP